MAPALVRFSIASLSFELTATARSDGKARNRQLQSLHR